VPELRAHDERRAGEHGHGPEGVGRTEVLGLDAESAEAVERERGEHLSGDPQSDRDHRAEAREEEDPGRDVDGAAQAAEQVPRLRLAEQPERVERARDRRCDEQERGADAELQRRRAERAAGGGAELDVGRCLYGEQRADAEQERDGRTSARC
jgi:hypothetical protein